MASVWSMCSLRRAPSSFFFLGCLGGAPTTTIAWLQLVKCVHCKLAIVDWWEPKTPKREPKTPWEPDTPLRNHKHPPGNPKHHSGKKIPREPQTPFRELDTPNPHFFYAMGGSQVLLACFFPCMQPAAVLQIKNVILWHYSFVFFTKVCLGRVCIISNVKGENMRNVVK